MKARIDKAVREGKVEFAPTAGVDLHEEAVQRVLEALGHPDAWVSDESMVADFEGWGEDRAAWLQQVSKALGFEVKTGDYIIDIAGRLTEKL